MKFSDIGRLAFAAALGFIANGCGGTPTLTAPITDATGQNLSQLTVEPRGDAEPALTPTARGQARWVLLPRSDRLDYEEKLPDGTRRLISEGMRIEKAPDGSQRASLDMLPLGSVRVLKLPARLGKGFVFYTEIERATWLWKSRSWTAPLEPLARIDPPVQDVVAGFDRLYLASGQQHELRAIDPDSGDALDLGSLPKAAAYYSLAFASPWLAAVNSDVRGLLVTFDSGSSWHALDAEGIGSRAYHRGSAVELRTPYGLYQLAEDGGLSRTLEDDEGDEEELESAVQLLRAPPVSARPGSALGSAAQTHPAFAEDLLATAVLHGFALNDGSAIVATHGSLVRVRLADGKVLALRSRVYPGRAPCHSLKLGHGSGFLCGEEGGASTLYSYEPTFNLSRVLSFAEPRKIVANTNGGLTIQGHCAGRGAAKGVYCLRNVDGRLREIRVSGDIGAERVTLLRDGRAAILLPPRFGAPGRLTLVGEDATEVHPLSLAKAEASTHTLLRQGIWLNGVAQVAADELATWVVGAGPFVGVRIKLDGTVQSGPVRENIAHASLNGNIGVVLSAGGVAFETTDFGRDWRAFKLPASLEWDNADDGARKGRAAEVRGCSAVGCAFGRWVRLGFGTVQEGLGEAAEPRRVSHFSGHPQSWPLSCSSTGQLSKGPMRGGERRRVLGALVNSAENPSPGSGKNLDSSIWSAFLRTSPPEREKGDLGLDLGHSERRVQFHSYTWGPPDSRFPFAAAWVVRAADRFALDSVWSTAVSRVPWDDAVIAAQTYGQDPQAGNAADWSLNLAASGQAGILRVRARATTELYLLERDRPILALKNSGTLDAQELGGVAHVRGNWYIGLEFASSFRLYRVEEGEPVMLAEYPLFAADNVRTQLVTSQKSDALGLWVRSRVSGWYIYKLDPVTGSASDPLYISPAELNQIPQTCSAAAQGWALISDVPLTLLGGSATNASLSFNDAAGLRANQLEAKLLVSPRGLCVERLAAQVEENSFKSARPVQIATSTKPLPLVLTDRATEKRIGFQCAR